MSKKKAFKKLIWAYDPFEGATENRSAVLATLEFFREKTKAAIQPAFVLSPASMNLQMSLSQPHVRQYLPSAEEVMKRSLKEVGLACMQAPAVIVQRTELLRDAVRAFLSFAKSKGGDLIVTTTHANRGINRLLLGSFTETLILHSKIPVLVVNPVAKARPIRKILFPTDFSAQSKTFFNSVCGLAKEFDAEVVLQHVIPHPIAPLFQSGVFLISGGWVSIPDYMTATEEQMRKLADRWKADASKTGVVVTAFFDAGRGGIRDSILARARETEIGLVAMVAQSGPVGAALLGSIVRQVVREAPCPVWIMRKG